MRGCRSSRCCHCHCCHCCRRRCCCRSSARSRESQSASRHPTPCTASCLTCECSSDAGTFCGLRQGMSGAPTAQTGPGGRTARWSGRPQSSSPAGRGRRLSPAATRRGQSWRWHLSSHDIGSQSSAILAGAVCWDGAVTATCGITRAAPRLPQSWQGAGVLGLAPYKP